MDSLAWNDQSIATKKDVINKVDFVFISAEDLERFNLAKDKLTERKVNNLLLDCSDAHSYSDANVKDRIGKCFSWIKADPTFEGLKQILSEPDERIFVGHMTPKMNYVNDNKTKYMKSVKIEKKSDATITETWFDDNMIPLNPGLIAIIGNKGKGKSALSDIIGLLGNTKQYANFTFLSEENFRRPKDNKARNFQATIEWESSAQFTKGLDDEVDMLKPELVKYIPQNYLENICTQLGKIEETDFDRELKKVIFSHLDAPDHLGKSSLDDLIAYKTSEADDKIQILKQELHTINEKIVLLEDEGQPTYKQKLENLLNKKNDELKAHEKSRPEEVTKPENDPGKQNLMEGLARNIEDVRKILTENEGKIEKANHRIAEITTLASIINNVEERIENLKRQVQTFTDKSKIDFDKLELALDSVLQFSVDLQPIRDKKQNLLKEKKKLDEEMDVKRQDTLANKKELIGKQIAELQAKLDEPNKKYQKYIVDLKNWEKKKEQIVGNNLTIDTLRYYENQIENLKELPQQLKSALESRLNKSKEIHSVIRKLGETYRELYTPVSNFVNGHTLVKEKFGLNFEVNIVDSGFEETFWELVSHGVSGTFCGVEEGRKKLQEILSKQDFENENGIVSFLEVIIEALEKDQRQEGGTDVKIINQLRKDKTVAMLYDMIFSLEYLCPRYSLRMADKELSQLSPGERGALLLVFYLLVDKDDRPLVIDQPEENLDNQTVYELLVPCMKEAKKRRQIVIVTHNPNLAVVCDAEQVIQANLDKKNNYKMHYISGSIENSLINKAVVDILEGTRPAFDKRDEKYL
jgi:ABC-type lipoprotein export system ATPase subunit